MPLITSRQHAIVRQCRAARRGDDPRLLLDGWHLVAEALDAGVLLEVLAVGGAVPPAEEQTLVLARSRGTPIVEVSSAVMDALSPVRAPTGVVALAARPRSDAARLTSPPPALVVAGSGLQDPGNVGALIRSAAAGGATGVLLDDASADPWGWKALRASMGSAFHMPVLREGAASERVARWRDDGLLVMAADPHRGSPMYDVDLTRPAVLLLGGEGGGLAPELSSLAEIHLRIPMRAGVESLNVAVAAALVVYEAGRQRAARDAS